MMNSLIQFAATETAAHTDAGILTQLGIDAKMLVLQLIAFLVLLFLLNRFVYPALIGSVDARKEQIDESRKLAEEAKQHAQSVEEQVDKLMKEARAEASAIVTTAKDEANAAISDAEKKARARGETIVQQAQEQIDKDIAKARQALRSETLELVALATEKVVGSEVSGKLGDKVIERAVSEAKA